MPDPADPGRLMPLLAGVSRSFYLSIRLLPRAMREPVALGYMLARATDTIADTTAAPAEQRLRWLDELASAVQGGSPSVGAAAFGSWQAEGPEKELMRAMPECLALLGALSSGDRDDVRRVLSHITRGQRQDIERFEMTDGAPLSREELDRYTFDVAGSVGEFWTRVAQRHVRDFSSLPEAELMALGRDYGCALQLVNILRDEAADLARGRRYIPEGCSRTELIAQARQGLRSGMRYANSVRPKRLRAATALPALLGIRTLALVAAAPGQPVKVPRSEVRKILLRISLTLAGRGTLDRLFEQGERSGRWDNARP